MARSHPHGLQKELVWVGNPVRRSQRQRESEKSTQVGTPCCCDMLYEISAASEVRRISKGLFAEFGSAQIVTEAAEV